SHDFSETILDDSQAAGGHAQPPAYKRAHGDAKAVAFLAQEIVARNLVILKLEHAGVGGRHAHLGGQVFFGETRAAGIHNESADAVIGTFGKRHNGRGDAGVGNEIFHAVEHEVIALALISHL